MPAGGWELTYGSMVTKVSGIVAVPALVVSYRLVKQMLGWYVPRQGKVLLMEPRGVFEAAALDIICPLGSPVVDKEIAQLPGVLLAMAECPAVVSDVLLVCFVAGLVATCVGCLAVDEGYYWCVTRPWWWLHVRVTATATLAMLRAREWA